MEKCWLLSSWQSLKAVSSWLSNLFQSVGVNKCYCNYTHQLKIYSGFAIHKLEITARIPLAIAQKADCFMLMNWPKLICELFGKERKLKANLIIKITNKVSSIVITILAQ